jgi:multidrug efflux pump
VFFGMLGVTLFGLLFTPVFYVALRLLATRRSRSQTDDFAPSVADITVR